MRRYVLVLVLLVLSVAPVAATSDPNSGLLIPEVLGEFSLEGTHDYESELPGLGFSAGYRTADSTATLYIYNLGESTIPDGIASDVVRGAFYAAIDEIRAAAERGRYRLTGEIQAWETSIGSGDVILPVLHAATELVLPRNLEPMQSHLYVLGCRNRIIKLRITNYNDGSDLAAGKRELFLADVALWLSR